MTAPTTAVPYTPPPRTAPTPTGNTPSAAPAFTRPTLGKSNRGVGIVLNAVEKWGKTSTAAFAGSPDEIALVLAPGETGYTELAAANLVPAVDYLRLRDWSEFLTTLRAFTPKRQYRVLALDALTGLERLCHEHVCQRDYNGDWGKRGFSNYQQGYQVAQSEWLLALSLLDRIRETGTDVILLGHVLIKKFSNPAGEDFDRYICSVHEKTWEPTKQWADAILFGTYVTVVDDHGKGIGRNDRVIYTQRRDAWDAGNRYGMPERIDLTNNPQNTWGLISKYFPKKEEK